MVSEWGILSRDYGAARESSVESLGWPQFLQDFAEIADPRLLTRTLLHALIADKDGPNMEQFPALAE